MENTAPDPLLSFTEVFHLEDPRNQMIFDLAALVHQGEWLAAGSFYAAYVRRTKDVNFSNPTKEDEVKSIVTQLVHWCLNNDRYPLASRLLWTDNLFDCRPHFTKMIWRNLKKSASVMLMGSASASKSYSTAVWLLLDWVRDPENTSVKLLGPSEKHLSEQLFTHIINLHANASIPLPGETGDLWIGLDRKNKFGSITGVIVPLGKKSAGRLQGTKAVRRNKLHPIFGTQKRLRVFMDESEKIPQGIWKDVDNIFSNLAGVETFKIICAYNPENQNGESGTRCEPNKEGGWNSFDIDKDEEWKSKRGWDVVRLDGFKGENVIHKRTIFPGLQTWESIQRVIENGGGYNSPAYFTMARAAFPPSSVLLTVIPQGLAEGSKGTFIFQENPTPFGAADIALEGGDAAPFAVGEYGNAVGYKTPPSVQHPQGNVIYFKDDLGRKISRPALQILQIFKMESGNAVFMANQIITLCSKLHIKARNLCLDTTGLGQPVYDIIVDKEGWSEVTGINYSENASETKILEEDTKTAKEEYDRACSELWFALKKWMEHKLVLFSPMIDFTNLFTQLTGRQYAPGKNSKVESKPTYKARNGGKSPDEADTATLIVAAVRKATGIIPSMKLTKGGIGTNMGEASTEFVARVDSYNRTPEDLDD